MGGYQFATSRDAVYGYPDADCYALSMISMRTMEELHSHNHTLALYCLPCNRWGEANLDWLIQNGKGNKPVTEARFRCRDCRKGGEAGAVIGWGGGLY